MGDFFHGWRRKIGLAALVLACLLMAGWARSCAIEDEMSLTLAGRLRVCDSALGKLRWLSWNDHGWVQRFEWQTHEIRFVGGRREQFRWESRLNKAEYDATTFGFGFHSDLRRFTIPFWSIVLPLTLISYWLLLIKPRSSIPKTVAEPIPEKAA